MFDTVRGVLADVRLPDRGCLEKYGWTFSPAKVNLATGLTYGEKYYLPEALDEDAMVRLPGLDYNGFLSFKVSLPKALRGENISLITEADLPEIFQKLDDFVGERTGLVLPSVGEWKTSRLDYCYTWDLPEQDVAAYISAFSGLSLPRHKRTAFQNFEGVCFKSRSNWSLFYDKFSETGDESAKGVLRHELRFNHSAANERIAKKLKTDRRLKNLLTDGAALETMNDYYRRLCPERTDFRGREGLIHNIVKTFGTRSAPNLLYFLELYELYGNRAYKVGLISKNQYYYNRKKLIGAGMTPTIAEQDLPRLEIR